MVGNPSLTTRTPTNENSRFLTHLDRGNCHSGLAQPGPLSLSSAVPYLSERRLILGSSNTEPFRNPSPKGGKGGPMKSELTYVFTLAVLLISSGAQSGGQERQKPARLALDKLELHNVKAEPVTYLGRRAMRVSDTGPQGLDDAGRLAAVPGSSFQDGTIEVNLSGDTAPDAPPNLRGFVGIAFRIIAD